MEVYLVELLDSSLSIMHQSDVSLVVNLNMSIFWCGFMWVDNCGAKCGSFFSEWSRNEGTGGGRHVV